MCNVHRRFIMGFAKIVRQLSVLVISKLPKSLPPPSLVEQTVFETLSDKLLDPPIFGVFSLGGHFVLHEDTSCAQLGCVLLLQQLDQAYLTVRYFSKVLNSTDRNFGVTEMEVLAVVLVVAIFHHNLEGEKFLIR